MGHRAVRETKMYKDLKSFFVLLPGNLLSERVPSSQKIIFPPACLSVRFDLTQVPEPRGSDEIRRVGEAKIKDTAPRAPATGAVTHMYEPKKKRERLNVPI